jgi:hypothetical protein
MVISEPHRACILDFAFDRERVKVIAARDSKQRRYRSLNVLRSKAMPKFETLPGERSASIISSIINLVCPMCGGSMMEFQCNGKCRRNWLPEWEWANFRTTRWSRAGAHREKR